MSAATKSQPERRLQAQHLVSELQEERDEVWALYCQIAELKPFNDDTDIELKLKNFAEIMVDYVSLGHFGIYDRLLAGTERRDRVLTSAKAMYPEFSTTTEAVVSFNDQYDDSKRQFNTSKLESDLSKLGESLATRMEIEDQLCALLLE